MDNETTQNAKKKRYDLRQTNLGAWAAGESAPSGIDTSLKRNTAFIKRLRAGLSPSDGPSAMLKEMAALRLDKYASELAPAAFEGAGKCKTSLDIANAVEIISALHERFTDSFTVPFITSLVEILSPVKSIATGEAKEKEDASRLARQRTFLRLFGELEAVAVVKGKDGSGKATGEELFELFKRLITSDKANLVGNLPLIVGFCRHSGELYLPSKNDDDTTALIPRAQKDKFAALLVAYFEALSKRAIKDRLSLLETDKRNHEAYIRSGQIFEDRAQAYEQATKLWEKEWSGLQTLSEHLGDSVTMPALPQLPSQTVSAASVTLHSDSTASMEKWLDEEEMLFYEELPDLKDHLSPDIIGGTALNSTIEAEVAKVEQDVEVNGYTEQTAASGDTELGLENADTAGPAARIDALLEQLPQLVTREMSDRLGIDIALQCRDKSSRKRAIKALINAPRHAQAVLAFYARVIAILSQVYPDIAAGVLAEIGRARLRTATYLCEVTKFGITPSHVIFHVFKACVDDLNGINIEHFCVLLEGCGRYLLRTASTREKMQQILDIAKRKQAAQNLEQRYVSMLDNAFTQADPPERVALPPKNRSNTTLFINHLIYDLLSRATIDRVLKSIRKLHWEEPETRRKLFNAFAKPWKIRSSHLQLLALLLFDLRLHPDFQVEVIDTVLERIREGLETNRYKHNQKRVADIKYLGELYNFRLVPARVIFDALWMLMTFAHPDGRPRPDISSMLDAPDDFFRARLLCVLLDTCCANLDKGGDRRKVDHVLVYFDLYLFCKNRPPMDIDYMVQDTFDALRPKHKRPQSLIDAANAVDDMLSSLANEGPAIPENDIDEEIGEADDLTIPSEAIENGESDDGEQSSGIEEDDDAPEEQPVARRAAMNTQDQEDFERELQAMMTAPSTDRNRNTGKPPRFDIGLPVGRRDTQARQGTADHTVFTMLSRRGGKAANRTVEIPDEVKIALSSRTRQLEDQAEKERMKRLVLNLAD